LAAKAFDTVQREEGDLHAAMAVLKDSIAIAWRSIQIYLGDTTLPPAPLPLSMAKVKPLAELLEDLMAILASDNPRGAETALMALGDSIDPEQLRALQIAIAKYKFREAERVVQGIAKEHKITLREA
jgi:hypothetical protein